MVYKLSVTLNGHTSDVRTVVSPSPTLVLSGSRDTKAISWHRPQSTGHFTPSPPFQAGSGYVNAVTYLPPTPEAPQGYLVAGGQDSLINIFPIGEERSEPSHTLVGHSQNVCTLNSTLSGVIISGSWDQTARVWKNFASEYELKGHTQAVWAAIAIDDDQFLTGSADKTIRYWVQHKSTKTYGGHTDAVRGLVLLPDIGFASCSNDSEIRVWTIEGDVIHILSGHTSFVYSLALLPNGDLVSGGEDRSVRVWKDGECSQVIIHPAISVWTVSTMSNGDIVSGASDGVVRVFSESDTRWADAEDMKKYDDAVSNQTLPSQQVGDVKKSELPGPEALKARGRKEGQVLMIKAANGSVEAYQWSSESWQKVGEVVDAVGSGRRQLYEGKEYDYVFDVDIHDGVPPLKLPYNASENPYQAALRFLQRNEISEAYIDQVVKFIEQNTSGVQLGGGGDSYVDPYTGTARYQASSRSVPTQGGGTYQDPFTGAGGYHGASAPTSSHVGSYQDTFTRSSGYHSASTAVPSPPDPPVTAANAVLPVRISLPFRHANIPAMRTKLLGLSDSFALDAANSDAALTGDETAAINRVFQTLNEASPSPTPTNPVLFHERDISVVLAVITRWPVECRFPAIDLARLIAGFAPTIAGSATTGANFVGTLLNASGWSTAPFSSPMQKILETNILLALRAFANLFQPGFISSLGAWEIDLLEELIKPSYSSLVKTHWAALGTIVLNFSTTILGGASTGGVTHAIQIAEKILSTSGADPEGQYRALVALGNLVYAHKANASLIDIATLDKISHLSAQTLGNEDRFTVVATEIEQLVSDAKRIRS